MNGPKITLIELGKPRIIQISEIKKWFPKDIVRQRSWNPWDSIKKWIDINRTYLDFLQISHEWDNDKGLILIPSNKIGLSPIKNPYGGKVYGSILVKPKIGWIKISDILDSIEWKLKPIFLDDEEPIMSEGILPRWLKAIDTLKAIEKALKMNYRGFKYDKEIRTQPTGKIDWYRYSIENIPKGQWNKFNSEFTNHSLDIDIHRQFKGVVEQIKKDLQKPYVPNKIRYEASKTLKLIENILYKVEYEIPDIKRVRSLNMPSFYRYFYEEAKLKVIEYLSQSKFSIYSDEYSGLPWSIEMDRLFEYWIEYWSFKFSKLKGANFYSDFKGNSKIKIHSKYKWEGLKELKPDIIIEKEDLTLIIDVKYKKHLMYLFLRKFNEKIIEDHRRDIHQILAYTSSSSKRIKKAILIYPKLLNDDIIEEAQLINYNNTNININLIKIDTSFNPKELLNKLDLIWAESISQCENKLIL